MMVFLGMYLPPWDSASFHWSSVGVNVTVSPASYYLILSQSKINSYEPRLGTVIVFIYLLVQIRNVL